MSALAIIPIGRSIDQPLIEATTNAGNCPSTRRNYGSALREFFAWWRLECLPFDRDAIHRYKLQLLARGLGASRINQTMAALKHLAEEAFLAGAIDVRTREGIAQVKRVKHHGAPAGRWLTETESAEVCTAEHDSDLVRCRDNAIVAIMLGAGIRREEVSNVELSQLQQRDGRWCLVDVVNKARTRLVPLPDWVYELVAEWLQVAAITEGRIFRRVIDAGRGLNRQLSVGNSLTGNGVWRVVHRRGVSPHVLRHTFSQRAVDHGADVLQIQNALGHSSLETTRMYLMALQKVYRGRTACDAAPDPRRKP